MAARTPARPLYDAIVDLQPVPKGEIPGFAFVLVKTTYRIDNGRAVLAEPEPLQHDIHHDETLSPRLPPGSDFWTTKAATDVIIQGSAFAPKGRPTTSMQVSARIGPAMKRIAVFGRRAVTWNDAGRISIERAEPFTEMPLTYLHAYGGLDPRVDFAEEEREGYLFLSAQGLLFDHPGAYPRNRVGKGYLVMPGPIQNFEMPNLEDPDDLLTAERLVTGSPERWYRQPLPWCFDWTSPLMYPRCRYADMDAWFPCPDDNLLPETRRGLLPPRLEERLRQAPDLAYEYYQEASFGMVLRQPLAGQPISLVGMHPDEPTLAFSVPADPPITVEIEGRTEIVQPRLTQLVLRPAEKKFYTVCFARTAGLPRAFIPEIHADIPISARIGRDVPLPYQSPATIRDRLAAGILEPAPRSKS